MEEVSNPIPWYSFPREESLIASAVANAALYCINTSFD